MEGMEKGKEATVTAMNCSKKKQDIDKEKWR